MRADIVVGSETIATIFCRDGEHALELAQEKYGPQARITNLQSFCRRCEERRWVAPAELNENQLCAECAESDMSDAQAQLVARMITFIDEWKVKQALTVSLMADALTALGGDGTALRASFPADAAAAMSWLVEGGWYVTHPRHLGSNRWMTIAEGNNGAVVQTFRSDPACGWVAAREAIT